MVVIAQLVRALVCGTRGRRFEPGYPPFFSSISFDVEVFFWNELEHIEITPFLNKTKASALCYFQIPFLNSNPPLKRCASLNFAQCFGKLGNVVAIDSN
jgi:hypothetical protein